MIKLQLLLRHPRPEPELEAGVRARLEQHGFVIDGSGRASVTVHITEAGFDQLFAQPAPLPAGLASTPTSDLPVPPGLREDITLITCAPRHATTHHQPRVQHASI